MNVKKFVMLFVKGIVKFMPASLLTWLKRSPKLTAFYSTALVKSGLFYGRPSKKVLAKLSSNMLERQQRQCKSLGAEIDLQCSLLIVVTEQNNYFNATWEEIHKLTVFDEILFFCTPAIESSLKTKLAKSKNDTHVYKVSTELDQLVSKKPVFVIYDEDKLKPWIGSILSSLEKMEIDVCYVDRGFYGASGEFLEPECYPDWNPDLHLTTGYIQTGVWFASGINLLQNFSLVASKELIQNWFVQYYFSDKTLNIYHKAMVGIDSPIVSSKNASVDDKVHGFLVKQTEVSKVSYMQNVRQIHWSLKNKPLVSLIIPTFNGKELVKQCINSILQLTTYKNFEIILVDNNSNEQDSIEYFEKLAEHEQITLLKYPYPFNYSAINNYAVDQCSGELVGLINNDIEVITPQWLEYMVGHALRQGVGCVGAKLLYPDNRIQHAGVVMGYGGGAGHAHKYFPREHSGYLNRIKATNNFSAVTAACLLVKREDYMAVGGLNETDLTVAFNDVDFCLKLLKIRKFNVYCAEAELYHFESISRGADDTKEKSERFLSELSYLKKTWSFYIENDPAYNCNLTSKRENFAIAANSELSV